ncbi:hypothetical protein DY123_07315 [Apilactobacillus micheneri]|uniref:AbiH family protein n=1 Tax=Apilactobacillus micheneri TaxID=1899430 RepID=UPI00112C2AFD|nr:AbiH family protein [Apilactobacillus micheneri]TPR41290.1 hypothetical protein DY123_07315 [Apilactobacillus micheneri]
MNEETERLIILGNGADIHNGLKSKFVNYVNHLQGQIGIIKRINNVKDYYNDILNKKHLYANFESKIKDIEYKYKSENIINDSNFWLFILIWKSKKDAKWYDIEKTIKNFLTEKFNKKDLYLNIDLYQELLDKKNLNVTINNEQLFIFLAIKLFNYKKQEISYFLLDELKKFEKDFSKYIYNNVSKNNYFNKNIEMLNKLCGNYFSNVLDFNYSTLLDKDFNKVNRLKNFVNIHGSFRNSSRYNNKYSPIILGIDSNYENNVNINYEDKVKIDKFTKTSRLLDFSGRKSDKILDIHIKNILFFGHSLGEADYSYFQSIFDYYHIYESNVKLTFVYAEYACQKQELMEITSDDAKYKDKFENIDFSRRNSQKIKVFKLINEYGETLDNKNHGKNLLHKLLLERRIQLVNLRFLDNENGII